MILLNKDRENKSVKIILIQKVYIVKYCMIKPYKKIKGFILVSPWFRLGSALVPHRCYFNLIIILI